MKGWIIQRLLNGFNLFLSGLLLLVLINSAKEWFKSQPSQIMNSESITETEIDSSSASSLPEEEFDFKEPILSEVRPQVKADLPVIFRGTASNGSKFFAVLEYEGQQSLVQAGERIGEWTIQNISEGDLILQNQRGESMSINRKVVSPPPSPAVKREETFKPLDQNHLQLDEDSFQDILSHWADLLREVQILPYVEKGKSKGYVLLNVRPNGMVQKLGLRTGDIIEKINGREVTNLASLLVLFEPLGGEQFKVDIKRGPKRIQMVYEITKGKGNI